MSTVSNTEFLEAKPINSREVDRQAALERLDKLAGFLDNAFKIPFLGYRVGWDGIIGLIPGIGDGATLLASLVLLFEGWRLGVSRWGLSQIAMWILIDATLGAIPILGDWFDLTFKANLRSVNVIRNHLKRDLARSRT